MIRTFFSSVFFLVSLLLRSQIPDGFVPGKPIPDGHSHNDYTRRTPLFEALGHGFTSLEVDIFLASDGTLRVSHIPFALRQKPVLRELYLEPLDRWVRQNGGFVFREPGQVLTLMIDLKGDGYRTYPVLRKELEAFGHLFTRFENGREIKGPVRVMLSGSKPWDLVEKEEVQWVCFDGSPQTDYSDRKVNVARVSAPFSAYFKKRPGGRLSPEEEHLMREMAFLARLSGREIRFWAAGNNPKRWRKLRECGVSVINVDRLKRFQRFTEEKN